MKFEWDPKKAAANERLDTWKRLEAETSATKTSVNAVIAKRVG